MLYYPLLVIFISKDFIMQESSVASVKYITVPQTIEGFEHIFGGWLLRMPWPEAPNGEFVALVDVGNATPSAMFVKALQKEVKHIDLVLLSHIHVDHAGALADVLEAFPMAKAVCHAKGAKHLIDPSRLWQSTKEVMTKLADMYGEPKAVPEEKLISFSPDELSPLPDNTLPYAMPSVEVMAVPGHAPHSLFFSVGGYYFIGEAASCTFEHNGTVYFRATTPPRFEMPVFLKSINKMLNLPQRPAFAGHSKEAYPSQWLLRRSREQLIRWHSLLLPLVDPLPNETEEAQLDRMLLAIKNGDADLGPLGVWIQKDWDIFFHKNSIRGFKDYLEREKQKMEQEAAMNPTPAPLTKEYHF